MPTKQWVNLDRNDPDDLRTVPGESPSVIPPERCGPEIVLRATISETESGTRLRGRTIWWRVELGSDNSEPDASQNTGWTNLASAGGFGGARGLYEINSTTGAEDGQPENEATARFVISGCGGDRFTRMLFFYTAKQIC